LGCTCGIYKNLQIVDSYIDREASGYFPRPLPSPTPDEFKCGDLPDLLFIDAHKEQPFNAIRE
jgi:hypothetical protein